MTTTTNGMHRKTDPETSREAAKRRLPHLPQTAEHVLLVMRELHRRSGFCGATDEEIEEACKNYVTPTGRRLKPNSFRTARVALLRAGLVEPMGTADDRMTRDGMTCWRPLTDAEAGEKLAGDTLF